MELLHYYLKPQVCIVTLFASLIEKATWGFKFKMQPMTHRLFNTAKQYKKKKKSFLFFFFPSSFVSSKGCTLGWTLIKIFFCLGPTSTSRASEKQIQIIGYPGRVLRLGENINIFTTETLLTSQSNIIKSNPFFSLLCGGKLTRSAAFLGKRDLWECEEVAAASVTCVCVWDGGVLSCTKI